MPFTFHPTDIAGVVRIVPKVFGDHRGRFFELFKATDFAAAGIEAGIVQLNVSRSAKGILRGLHLQSPPYAQGKIVSCVAGRIWDVAADVRVDSPTYGRWVGVVLDAETPEFLYVAPGLAHGFCVHSESADVMYAVTHADYHPEAETGIAWNDPTLAIDWPIDNPILSEKDARLPPLGGERSAVVG